ncbi:methionine--tRNA ligase [Rhodopila globiformis]|uniref:Methionine--tRNA ligase n=1 Tax=Rhodopila globiformis TaxID=1071 RepID=A0A2S6NI28_RHOGL|nr:methionine--tRNA ligase [Rhodopila globiformis]PPQ34298.1 methionine--tRNA ligase [Rhodopila globiformis]
MTQRFYITTPIYYVNGTPHIGHAYTSIATDVMARFKRLDGYDVFFLTGTDEHGQKVQQAAAAAGVDPQSFTDRVSADFRAMTDAMGVAYDDWIRTTEQRHKVSCTELWRRIAQAGDIYLDHYEGWYAVRDEAFYDESELTTRPDGTKIAPSGAPVEWVREPSYFFKLSAFQDRLLKLYEEQPDFVAPSSRRSEVISFVKGGLRDLSVSRTTFSWGIPVPDAPGHVMYVWLDALNNYVTACGFPDENAPRWPYWPADVHVVGKDIIRFHAVYWPAFLMSAGLPLPKRVSSHGWWVVEGEKMSKSLGNVIEPRKLVETYGLDQIRYFLLREKPFGGDGSMSHPAIVSRINVELANDLGNLAQRTLSLVARNCGATLPARGEATEDDAALLAAADALLAQVRVHIDRQTFHEALEEIWKVIRAANGYIDRQAPWALNKTDKVRMGAVLRVLVDTIRVVATLLQPVMPGSMARMLDQLGVPADARTFAALATRLNDGAALPPPQGVFPRYVEPAA